MRASGDGASGDVAHGNGGDTVFNFDSNPDLGFIGSSLCRRSPRFGAGRFAPTSDVDNASAADLPTSASSPERDG